MVKERLQKLLSRAGVGSRRACEQLILDGRISVNGEPVISLPVLVDPKEDRILLDGKAVKISPEAKIYVMLNKPKGVVCTASDEQGRTTVLDLLPEGAIRERIFPVGRLEKDSQGLLLLTNDGELTKKLTHPSYGVERVYQTEVVGRVDGTVAENLLKGVWLAEGKAKVSRVKIIKKGSTRSLLEITLRESKNRQVRRMLAKLGLPVRKLARIRMGSLVLKGIGIGRARRLTPRELTELRQLVDQKP